VTFSIAKGTIHALIGENGAGKSTLMKILFGLYQPDSGTLQVEGREYHPQSPRDARAVGIGMVQQHFVLAGPLSALDHVALEDQSRWTFWQPIPRSQLRQQLEDLSLRYHMPVHWDAKISDLSVGLHQRIEILKILRHPEIQTIILDEPTAVLAPQEILAFFQQLKALKAAGKTIVLITHKLKEVLSLADNFTVLRQGRCVHTGSLLGRSEADLAELMIGKQLPHLPPRQNSDPRESGPALLHFQNFSRTDQGRHVLRDIQFSVRKGEIVGLAGIEGNGQSEILRAILNPPQASPEISGELGLNAKRRGSLPEDRILQGLLLDWSPAENFLLGNQTDQRCHRKGRLSFLLDWTQIRHWTQQVLLKYAVTPNSLKTALRNFSGGNQQKFVVGRELFRSPDLLLAAHPSRGVDIGAIAQIHAELIGLRNSGVGIFLVSSELDELLQLSDRLLVIQGGRLTAEFARDQFNKPDIEMQIGLAMAGGGPA